MARTVALLTLAFFGDASLALSDPLFHRQLDPSALSSSSLGTAALSTGLVSSVASAFNASSAFSTISLSTGVGVSGAGNTQLGTGVLSSSTADPSSSAVSSAVSSAASSDVFPSLSLSSRSGLTGSGTGTAAVPASSSVASSTVPADSSSTTVSSTAFPSLSLSSDKGVTGSGAGTGAVPIPSSSSKISSTDASNSVSSSGIASSTAASSGQSAGITSSSPTSSIASSTDAIVTASTTITSLPTGAKLESLTGSVTWTENEWITTTSSGDSSSTVVPIIFPLISGKPGPIPIIIWGGITPPTIKPPAIQLKLPELGCIQFLGIKIGSCPGDENPDDPPKSDDPSKSTEKSTEKSSSSECSSKTATFTTIKCSSAGASSSCETKTSETVGCSVTGSVISSGSCVASTTVASSTICCSSTSVTAGKTVCAFETFTNVAAYPSHDAQQTSVGTAQLLSALGAYYSSFGAANGTTNSTIESSRISSGSEKSSTSSSASLPASTSASSTASVHSSSLVSSTAVSRSSGSTPKSTLITSHVSSAVSSSSAAPSSTPPPICNEGNNELMGFNNEPSSWCFCGGRGPFSTIDKSTTNYCNFTSLPTETISLTTHSTSIDTACHISTTSLNPQTTADTYCQCGVTIAGIDTTTIAGGTMLVNCQIAPSGSIVSTITPTPTPTPEPVAPYADQGGQCHIHVNELGACAEDDEDLEVEVTMWDVKGAQIGYQALIQAGANSPLKMKSKLEALLEVTAEHTGDYIQFTLGTESWTSKDNDQTALAYCNTGGWDPKEDPWSDPFFVCAYGDLIRQRQMDCYFQCPWHGGKSSDA